MRIALVTETFLPRVDGIVRMLLAFLAHLETHGHTALLFAPGAGAPRCGAAEVVWVRGVPCPLYPGLVLAPFAPGMARRLRAWRPDVVHLAGPFVLGGQGVRAARALRVPAAAHYQTDLPRFAGHYGLGLFAALTWRRLLALHNACAVNFAPTRRLAADLRARGMRNVAVSGRGVDSVLFHPGRRDPALRARITGDRERPILAYVGRIAPEKGLATLIALAHAVPDCTLLVVGDGPARPLLARALAGRDVHFTGWLHGPELAAAYATADLFVFPSATETFGQVVREAMASGLPVVGVRAGGVQDLVQHEVTGLLCPPDDPESMIAATRRLVDDPALRRQMGGTARRQATTYTWESVFNELLEWYTGLTSPATVASRRGSAASPGRIKI